MSFDMFSEPAQAGSEAPEMERADVFSKAVVLQLQFRRMGTQRKVSSGAVDVKGETDDQRTDRDLLHVTRDILDSPELEAIEKHDGQTARFVEARKSGPAFANQGGFHLVARTMQPAIDAWIAERLAERGPLVEAFIDRYDERCAETDRRLGPLAAGDVRPARADVRELFGVTVRYMTFGYTDEAAARAWQAEALNECRQALRAGFAEVVDRMAEKLQPGDDGKPKTIRSIKKFEEFIDSFEARNLADDRQLAGLVAQARELMRGVSAQDLRKKEGLRAAVATRIAEIKATVDAEIIDKPTRRYSDDE